MTPAPLSSSRPRAVRLTTAGRALAAVATILLLAAIGVPAIILRLQQHRAAEHREFAAHGVVTDAEVVRQWKTSGEKNREMVAYRYVADGRIYEAQSNVRSALLRGVTPGSLLRVRYLPSDARQVTIEGSFERDLPLVVPYLIGAGLALIGLVCVKLVRAQVNLLTEGRATTATVTATKTRHSSHGGSHQSVSYAFRLLSGAIATGRADISRKPPAVGSTIDIIYDPDLPTTNRPYPLSLVRPG